MLILVRHPQTVYGAEGKLQGCKEDVSLSPLGLAQKDAIVNELRNFSFVKVYTSPLSRCRDVARQIYKTYGVPLEIHEDLKDLNVGVVGGLHPTEFEQKYPEEWLLWTRDHYIERFPGGESLLEAKVRASRFLEKVDYRENVVILSHSSIIPLIISCVTGILTPCLGPILISEGGITLVDPNQKLLVSSNYTGHLKSVL